MKAFIIMLSLSLITCFAMGQETVVTETRTETGLLGYKRELAPESSYKVTKNTSGHSVPVEVLEEINMHRRFDADYLWVVNENLEILIYYVNKPAVLTAEPK
jgi:hypothetical protein